MITKLQMKLFFAGFFGEGGREQTSARVVPVRPIKIESRICDCHRIILWYHGMIRDTIEKPNFTNRHTSRRESKSGECFARFNEAALASCGIGGHRKSTVRGASCFGL